MQCSLRRTHWPSHQWLLLRSCSEHAWSLCSAQTCFAGLRELSLAYNEFTHLPPALATATALEQLDCNGLDPALLSEDALEILSGLPHLRGLCLDSFPQGWQRRLPHVQERPYIAFWYEDILGLEGKD